MPADAPVSRRVWSTHEDRAFTMRVSLRVADSLRGLLRLIGVDYPVFRQLLRARLLIGMRPATRADRMQGVKGTVFTLVISAAIGLGTGFVSNDPSGVTWVALSQSVLFVLLNFSLLMQMVGILVDPSDVQALSPHPVPDRTLFAARLFHLFSYVGLVAAAFSLTSMGVAVFRVRPAWIVLVYPLLSLLCALTAVGGVAFVFALLLRIAGPARFQRVSLWVQILCATFFMGGMQVLPVARIGEFAMDHPATRLLWPPLHQAALFDLVRGAWSLPAAVAAACALLLPAAALLATLRLASRYFVAGLEGRIDSGRAPAARWSSPLWRRIGDLVSSSREERVGFDFTRSLSLRESHVLRGALPQLVALQLVSLTFARHTETMMMIVGASFLAMSVPTILQFTQFVADPEGRWIFRATPVADESALLRGGIKGLLVTWYLPVAVGASILQVALVGVDRLLDVLLLQTLCACAVLFVVRVIPLGVPFCRKLQVGKVESDNLRLLLLMAFAIVIIVAPYEAVRRSPLALGIAFGVTTLVLVFQVAGLRSLRIAPEYRVNEQPRALP